MFVVGGSVRGGRVYGQWPGLRDDQLFEGRDLALTTDFRDVFGEVAAKHLGNADLKKVFPGYEAGPAKFRGLVKAGPGYKRCNDPRLIGALERFTHVWTTLS